MKIRGAGVKAVASAAVVLMVGSFLFFAGLPGSQNFFHHNAPSKFEAATSARTSASSPKLLESYGKLPLSFIENQGQTAQEVRYVSHGSQFDLFLTPQEAVVALRHSKHFDLSPRHRAQSLKALSDLRRAAATTTTALRMQFEGANPGPQIAGTEQLPGVVNYYIGNDAKKWHRNVPTFARVKYTEIYPGVDLVFYGNQRKLEYDFVVAPGADPNVIRMNLRGAKKLRMSAQGGVLVSVAGGEVELQKPVVYQNIAGKRQEIAGKYSLRGHEVSFAVAQYDRREPLIVDPVLDYSTYLGGTGDEQSSYSIATDTAGDAYIVGQTTSANFPTASPLSTAGGVNSSNTGGQGFVTKLNPTGTTLLFSTYLGGTGGGDQAFGVAVDSTDSIYVTGFTNSIDFPTNGTVAAFKSSVTSIGLGTSFLTKISSAGALTYSTYLGGTTGVSGDYGNAVATDGNGNAYVTGITYSASGATSIDFPLMNQLAYGTTPNFAVGTSYLSVVNTKTGLLTYSTYLGGDGLNNGTAALNFGDQGFGVVVDSTGKAYIVGTTTSSNFPTSATFAGSGASFQPAVNAANKWGEAYLTEIDTTKSGNASLVYSTYLGGSGSGTNGDFGFGVDIKSGTTIAYVSGLTDSADFPLFPTAATCTATPTTCPFQTASDTAAGAAFVALLDTSSGTTLKYGTYLGAGGTIAYSIKADAGGNAYVGGGTSDSAFPVSVGAFQRALAKNAGVTGPGDGFIFELSPLGKGTADGVYGSYFGGSGQAGGSPDEIFGIALGTVPTVFVTGQTFSADLPVFPSTAAQTALKGSSDAFIASLNLVPTLAVSTSTLTFTATKQGVATASQAITLTNNTSTAIPFTSATIISPSPAAAATDFVVTNTSCGTSIPAGMSCALGVVFTASTTSETATVSIVDGDSSSPQTVALTGTAPALFQVMPTSLTFTSSAVGTATAAQMVTITNGTGAAVPFTSATVTLTSATGNKADFAVNSTNCGISVPIAGCTISVVYTPSVAATETANLVLVDGDASSPQTIALTGSVTVVQPGFGLTTSQSGVLTIKKGSSGMFNVSVNSTGGFNSAVALTCSGEPRKSTCMIVPSSVTPPANGTMSAAVTIATTALVAPPPSSAPRFPPVSIRMVTPVFAAFLMLLLFLSERRFRTRLGLVGALLVFVALAGCAASGTPKGNSTITITGTSGTLTQTVTVQVTVD